MGRVFDVVELYRLFCVECARMDATLPFVWQGTGKNCFSSHVGQLSREEQVMFKHHLHDIAVKHLDEYRFLIYGAIDAKDKMAFRVLLQETVCNDLAVYLR